ncbi:MAG: hypothetical protein WDZ49_06605 [Litorilinea sp.]
MHREIWKLENWNRQAHQGGVWMRRLSWHMVAMAALLAVMGALWDTPGVVQAQTLRPPAEWQVLPGAAAGQSVNSSVNPTGTDTPSIWAMSEEEYAAWAGLDALAASTASVAGVASVDEEARAAQVAAVLNAEHTLFLPRTRFEPQLSTRMGYGVAAPGRLANFPVANQLNAGWYQDWTIQSSPAQPNNMEYVQTVRLHQDLTCPVGTDFDRTRCPYVVPYSYSLRPGLSAIRSIALARPGSLWLIGNEMDRIDWGDPTANPPFFGHQDEMLPELYAKAYHDLYTYIKGIDPTAKIAIGGIIQPTPVRLQYLTQVWDTYFSTYQTTMPVDVWNTHNFMIREGPNRTGEWGAGVPPGVNAIQGEFVGQRDANGDRNYHIDMAIFDAQIRAFRQWMKDRGQQDKPLIVSEYGVLFPNDAIFLNYNLYYAETGSFNYNLPDPIVNFMLATFNYFMTARDCEIGFVQDNCRLVQGWNWFSLNVNNGFNVHGSLVSDDGTALTPAGQAFGEFSRRNVQPLSLPYPIPE